jgi:ubiquinone/menaquinone biosynthesis C-methylase UbiE
MIFQQQDWLFHWLAPFYDYLIRPSQADRLKDLLNLSQDNYLLDLGGGTGRVSRHFMGLGAKVLVCDINRSMLKQAKRKKGLVPLQADAARLPFPSEAFDAILVVDALHHFLKPRRTIGEMLRVLKPGGRLLIEEQDINHFVIKLVQKAERIVGLHSHFLTQDEISALFSSTGHRLYFEKGNFFTFRILCRRTPDHKLETNM